MGDRFYQQQLNRRKRVAWEEDKKNLACQLYLDEEPTPIETISRIVSRRLRENDKLIVSVKAHPKTAYTDYIRVIDQLKMADAKRISIANSE